MIRLPARPDGQWTLRQNSDKLPDLSATKNLTFDKEGYLRLSKPTISFYSDDDDADFGLPVGYGRASEGQYFVLTDEKQFTLDFTGGSSTYGLVDVAEDTNTNTPDNTGSGIPDVTYFDHNICYTNPADRKCYTHPLGALTNSWTVEDTSALISNTNDPLPSCNFQTHVQLAVAEDNLVTKLDTSYAEGGDSPLVLPGQYKVTGVAYNNGYIGITTHHTSNTERCLFAIWDGHSTEANFITEVPAVTGYSPIGYQGWFVFLDGNGILWQVSPAGLQLLAALPIYYSSGYFSLGSANNNVNHSIVVKGEVIYINIKSYLKGHTENGEHYRHSQPAGIWCYDPAVGLYHRHSPTGTKVITDTIATTSVSTGDDQITVAAAPDTGTPVRYSDGTGTAIGGLTNQQVYYTIKVDGTTVQLATTDANATAGTQVDLTGTGNNNQTLQFYPKTDFGQSYSVGQQGVLFADSTRDFQKEIYFHDFFYGGTCAKTGTTEKHVGGYTLRDTENRGYLVTSRFQSSGMQDDWQKLFLKHSELTGEFDKLVVKYRTDQDEPLTYIKDVSTDGLITWSDSDTFTTTDTQWANVAAGDEVEIIQGTGSGYLVHVSSISEAGGTYTVNIDESIKNLTASDTGRAIASRWTKEITIDSDSVTNGDGYSEITLGVKSKTIQFKVELRGEDVEIEELLVANELYKPV